MKSFFVAGTDTDVGKTLISASLLKLATDKGLSTAAIKPVAAGCGQTHNGLRNSDALMLQKNMSANLDYEQLNPIALEEPIAPHIAAAKVGRYLKVQPLVDSCQSILDLDHQLTVIEGAGGWRVPLNPHETLADVVKALSIPVVLVVGLRLGCLSHALLTVEAIANDGLILAGWVANQLDETMPVVDENLATLAHRIDAPCLGHIPFLHKPSVINASKYLDIGKILA